MKMSLVLPVYNEAETLRQFFNEVASALEGLIAERTRSKAER